MKNYSKYICLFLLLVGMSVSAWGQLTITVDFTYNNVFNLRTTDGSDYSSEGTVSAGGYSYKVKANKCYYSSDKLFFGGTTGAYIVFPAIAGKKLTKVTFNPNSSTGGAKVNICPTNTQTATTGGDDQTFSNGSTTAVSWTLTATSANTAYRAYFTNGKNLHLKSWVLQYSNTDKYTITFDEEGGSCATTSLTEGSIDAGVTLPSASPSATCASDGWAFYGWATSAVSSSTTTVPTIVGKAGDKYYPTSSHTLHAVYVKGGEYTKVTSTSGITSGAKYLIAGYYASHNHIMTNNYFYTDDYYLQEKIVDETSSGKYTAAAIDARWLVTITGSEDEYIIQDNVNATNNYLDITYLNWYGRAYDEDDYPYTIDFSDEEVSGGCSIHNNWYDTDNSCYWYLVLCNTGDFGTNSSEWAGMQLYKETEAPTFNSDPSCCDKIVELSEGEENHAEFLDFSSFNQPTCSSTAADRQVTMIVEPDAGYELTSSARLEWLEATGTFDENSPTYISGPTDNGDGTYNFVYQFAQNDNGGGFFNVTATPKDYTISFNSNGGSGSMDDVEKTYNTTYTLPACTFTRPTDKIFDHWAAGSTSGTSYAAGAEYTMGAGNITFYAIWRTASYTEAKFSCAELTLTPHLVTDGTPIFITSVANKKVRSQDYITITGSGLTPNTALTFPSLNSKFEVLTATGGTISTDPNGEINVNAYIFYTPAAGATTDGIDEMSGLTVSVGGAKPKTVNLIQGIIGRHLPADFVIAAKNTTTNKWYALPANMLGTGNPVPVEIAVDDINNPTIAYTAASNVYNLYLSADKEKVQLGMKNNVDGSSKSYALWANNAASSTDIGKNTGLAENTLGNNYKWTLTQTNTSITNPQDAKYTISNLNNDNPLKSWFAASGGPKWGLYASGVAELRLIPASDIVFAEASVVEWGQHGGVVEVDAEGIDATSVVAHLGEDTSDAIELVQTKAGDAKNKSSKYNYTVNFGDDIDFADAESNGAMLTLEWYNSSDVKVAVSNIVVPKIVASTKVIVNSTNYPTKSVWDTEVHVLPGDTLEIDASGYDKKVVTISELNIYPGATVKIVGTNDSLNVRSLVLRNGWTRVGTKRYNVARLYVGNTSYLKKANNKDQWYSDWYIDYDQYYPIAVPFPVATSSISYKNSNSAATAGVRLRYYSGALRATNIQQNQDANWVEYNWNGSDPAMPTNLEPSHGYIMTARRPTGKAFSIVRMPLTFSNDWTALGEKGEVGGTHKDQVTVTAYGDESTPSYAKGWNIIANPYMAVYTGTIEYGDETKVNVVNIPDVDFREYDQVATATAKLKPGSAFLVQAPKTGVVTFGAANRQLSMPSYRREVREETEPEQQAYIVLSNEDAEDMMGIFVSDKYTAEYDLNGDVEKMLSDGTTLRTYMRYNDMNMAYVAIDKVLAQEPIPVSVRIPNDGEYTFSLHKASIVANLEGIYLIDHYEGNRETNLLEEGYTFYSPAGTIADRFTINAKVGARDVPTDIDVTEAEKNSGKAVKFLYRDKLYILRSGRIYDATGKQVKGGAQ